MEIVIVSIGFGVLVNMIIYRNHTIINNICHSYREGYGFDTRPGYPY
jgi:hypothetical protein